MKNKIRIISRILVITFVVMIFMGTFDTINAEAAVGTPRNCRFDCWNGSSFTIRWNSVKEALGYQVVTSWTDGSHVASGLFYNNYAICHVSDNHVRIAKVRAFNIPRGTRKYGAWSNPAFIVPFPQDFTVTRVNPTSKYPQVRIKWDPIYGSSGYNIFLTTNRYNNTWRWNQSTKPSATATTAIISRYKGGYLKKYTNYYVRVVTRRRYNGVYVTNPLPSSDYWSTYIRITK